MIQINQQRKSKNPERKTPTKVPKQAEMAREFQEVGQMGSTF